MISKRTKLSIFEGFIFLALAAATLVVYFNWFYAHASATRAQLTMQDYAVGTEYAGIITEQTVSVGDNVQAGQLLFKLKSDALMQALDAGTIKPENLSYKLSDSKELLITAGKAGRVRKLEYPQGSFVAGNKQLALISDTSSLGVSAEYVLPRADLGRITPDTSMTVELPSHERVTARITQVVRSSKDGHDLTTVQARLAPEQAGQLSLATGAEVKATANLTSDTYYTRLLAFTDSLISRWY